MEREVSNQHTRRSEREPATPLPGTELARAQQKSRRSAALTLLAGLCAAGLLALLRLTPDGLAGGLPGGQTGSFPPPTAAPDAPHGLPPGVGPLKPFNGWNNPELALVLSGEQHGYYKPCGCSAPQFGGLTRRYNFVEQLRKKGWPVVAVDLGDIPDQKASPQLALKYKYSMQSLQKIGYTAVGVGQYELAMPLVDAISQHRLNSPTPKMLAATLRTPASGAIINGFIEDSTIVPPAKKGGPTVGVFGIVGKSVTDEFAKDKGLGFKDNRDMLIEQLGMMLGKADVTVLLYQGSFKDAQAVVEFCYLARNQPNNPMVAAALKKAGKAGKANQIAKLDVLLCLSPDPEPPSEPTYFQIPGANAAPANGAGVPGPGNVKNIPTMVINVGHKGRSVGVVGVFRGQGAGQPLSFKYQWIRIGEEYETPKGQEKGHPIMAVWEEYAREVKDGNYILKYPPSRQHPIQHQFPNAEYVGSARCANCHDADPLNSPDPKDAFQIWKKTKHSHAFAELVKPQTPSLRQYDGECVACHVTGFEYKTGYLDAVRATNNQRELMLQDVGCESCHGPGSPHVAAKNNAKIHALMNPWKSLPANKKQIKINDMCMSCHDSDNDVHWNFAVDWPKIAHPSPKKNAAAPGPAVAPGGAPPVLGDPPALPLVPNPK